MGSKARLAKHILPIILEGRTEGQWYVEPFAGGMNIIDKADGNRMANDTNEYLIAMWRALVNGWTPPEEITKEQYSEINAHKNNYEPHLIGWVGFNCSYSGKFWGGYAGKTKTKIDTVRDYQAEAIKNIAKQTPMLKGVSFSNEQYYDMEIPDNSIIYCDPPYLGTTGYKGDFDHELFFDWVKDMAWQGHSVFVSEYQAPEDFDCLYRKELNSSLSANGKAGGNKRSTECLFTYKC